MTTSWHRAADTAAGRTMLAVALLAALGSAQAEPRFTISAGGTEVTDNRTGLVWRRCTAGHTFSAGACNGVAATYTHEQALAYARSQTGWRLPNVKELSSIVDRGRSGPSIDVAVFPNTASEFYWTSTPWAGVPGSAWGVQFGEGGVGGSFRNFSYHVRLVR